MTLAGGEESSGDYHEIFAHYAYWKIRVFIQSTSRLAFVAQI
jgi:hypothetical protein